MAMSQKIISAFIADKTLELGSLHEALAFTQHHLLEHVAVTHEEVQDLFPIPPLHQARGQLCRCRGMIQEIHSEVSLYCARSSDFFNEEQTAQSEGNTSKPVGEKEELLDTVVLYVIPVPGNEYFYALNRFDDEEEKALSGIGGGAQPSSTATARKRTQREEAEEERTGYDDAFQSSAPSNREAVASRTAADARGHASSSSSNVRNTTRVECPSSTTEGKDDAAGVATAAAGPTRYTIGSYLNLPYPPTARELSTACIVTVILPRDSKQGTTRSAFRVNDVVDFYGYIQLVHGDQMQVSEESPDEFDMFNMWHSAELSNGLVSRLVCLAYTPTILFVHGFTFPGPLSASTSLALPASVSKKLNFEEARERALQYITRELCCGDALTAEYLLLHLCSHVGAHTETTPVGDVPLLISAPAMNARAWSAAIARITPVAEIFLDAATLGKAGSATHPKHDSSLNYLRTGLLQVGNGTHVTIDCAGLAAQAESSPWGEVLFSVIRKQALPLEYPYHTMELPVDVSFLVVSRGIDEELPTMLNFALQVDWVPEVMAAALPAASSHPPHCTGVLVQAEEREEEEQPAAAAAVTTIKSGCRYEEDSESNAVRQYIAAVQSVSPSFVFDEVFQRSVSDALVNMTEELGEWNNRDPLIHNNTFSAATALMRAHAASKGRAVMTPKELEHVLALERKRIERRQEVRV